MYFIVIALLISFTKALNPPAITGTTAPPIDCRNFFCRGRADGNYELRFAPNYFLQCFSGIANCLPCWPLNLYYVKRCNQCLYNRNDECSTTPTWVPATTFFCPDLCPSRGPDFSSNIEDPNNRNQYIACWKGLTIGCIVCPAGLEFNEQWNACLYEGRYKTFGESIGNQHSNGNKNTGHNRGRKNIRDKHWE